MPAGHELPVLLDLQRQAVLRLPLKSFGCEKRMAHLSPIHWWKSILPSVVSAWKLGAVSPMRKLIKTLLYEGSKW